MTWMICFLVLALVFQLVLFFVIRKKKRAMKEKDILSRYDINSRADLFRWLANPELDEQDRELLQALYDGDREDHS